MEKVVILGGGVAGLSCLNALLDLGVSPLLLEGSSIGTPKMCGEFLAPQTVSLLRKWDIGPLIPIKQIHFLSQKSKLTINLPRHAAAFARSQAELGLARYARACGGRIREHAHIEHVEPSSQNEPYAFHLSSGEVIRAEYAIFATGRFSIQQKALGKTTYMGFKTHVHRVLQPETLVMQSLNHGYLGIVPIDSETSNLTCLVQKKAVQQAGGRDAFLQHLFKKNHAMMHALESVDFAHLQWIEGDAPSFGLKKNPPWPRAFWIGDAFASLLPSIGYGFAHSIYSAESAAAHFIKSSTSYHQNMRQHLHMKWKISQAMHYVLQKPKVCMALSLVLKVNPWISQSMLNILDY